MGVAVRLYRSLLRTGRKIELKARSLPEHSPQRIKLVQARLHWLANLSITGASQHCADAQVTRAWFEDPARTDLDVGFAALRQMEQSLHRTDHALAWKKLLDEHEEFRNGLGASGEKDLARAYLLMHHEFAHAVSRM